MLRTDCCSSKEVTYDCCNLGVVCFKCKMTGVEESNLGVGQIAFEGSGAGRQKERIVLAPDGQQWRTVRAKTFLKQWVERDITGVIQKEIQLNFGIARASHKRTIQCVRFRCDPL